MNYQEPTHPLGRCFKLIIQPFPIFFPQVTVHVPSTLSFKFVLKRNRRSYQQKLCWRLQLFSQFLFSLAYNFQLTSTNTSNCVSYIACKPIKKLYVLVSFTPVREQMKQKQFPAEPLIAICFYEIVPHFAYCSFLMFAFETRFYLKLFSGVSLGHIFTLWSSCSGPTL